MKLREFFGTATNKAAREELDHYCGLIYDNESYRNLEIFHFPLRKMSVGVIPQGNVWLIVTSVCAPGDTFHEDTGAAAILMRLHGGVVIPIPRADEDAQYVAENISNTR